MDLDKLLKSVSKMTDEELLEHITRVRSQRVIRAVPAKKAAAARSKSLKSKDKLGKLMEGLPAEVRQALIEKFGGGK